MNNLALPKSPDGKPSGPPPMADFASSIGERLRVLMERKGRSLDVLAAYSGLGRKTLDLIASGEASPPIALIWRLANALGVPFGSLVSAQPRRGVIVLRSAARQVLRSADGRVTTRPLFPHDCQRLVEFYELTIAPGHTSTSEAHRAGTLESLVVVRGETTISVGRDAPQKLQEGDAMIFDADVPHSYHNPGAKETLLHLVMSYINLPGA